MDFTNNNRGKAQVNIEEAIQHTIRTCPFEGYMRSKMTVKGMGQYYNITNTILRYLKPGSKILDFGCGSCDITALLQFIGFRCSGYDNFQDYCYTIEGNREKIVSFAESLWY